MRKEAGESYIDYFTFSTDPKNAKKETDEERAKKIETVKKALIF